MTVFQYVGNTAPSVPATIQSTLNGVTTPLDLTTATVNFRMRSLFGTALLIDAPAVIVGAVAGQVRYDWTLADVTTAIGSSPGPYRGWWHVVDGAQTVDTPEFEIDFLSNTTILRTVGPCTDWASTQDVIGCYPDVDAEEAGGLCLTSAVAAASEVLYEMSGHVFGGWCQTRLRPCSRSGCFPWPQVLSRGHIVWGESGWYGESGEPCQCGGWLSQVPLPGVAQTIVSVTINGEVLSPDTYRLDPNNMLVRVGGGLWPICQDLSQPATAPGTFEVVFTHSYQPPTVGRQAAAELAHEFWKACKGQPCALPTGTVEVVRQGLRVRRNADLWSSGSTGLSFVDSFLAAYGQKPGFLVLSPEVVNPGRRIFP